MALDALSSRVAADLALHGDPAVQRAVLGLVDPEAIADAFERWTVQHLASEPVDCWLWAVSVGCVAGFELGDGSNVVVKAYSQDRPPAMLQSMHDVQRLARSVGLPVPEPLVGPQPLAASFATADAALLLGRHPNLMDDRDQAAAARGFVELIDALRDAPPEIAAARPRSLRSVSSLYPIPHSPVFDFEVSAAGAEWIDALAVEAKTVMDQLQAPLVLAHMDWRAENLRVSESGDEVVAIFDCDSIRREREAIAVGEVAASYSIDYSDDQSPYFATGEECLEFARSVERCSDRSFTAAEWSAIRAGIVYGWCYGARCEHALACAGNDAPKFKMRERLAADGKTLLSR